MDQRRDRPRRRAARRAAGLLVAGALVAAGVLGGAGPSAAVGAPVAPPPAVGAAGDAAADTAVAGAPDVGATAWLRTANLLDGAGTVDLRLAPFSGEGGNRAGTGLARRSSYGEVDAYAPVRPEQYAVTVRPAGARDGEPLVATSVALEAGRAYTLVATAGPDGGPGVELLEDDLTPPVTGQSDVRLVSAVPLARARLDGGATAELAPGPGAVYLPVPAGDRLVEVSDGAASTTLRLGLASRSSYTLFVRPGPDGALGVRAVLDQAAAEQAPVGGVDTGGGWLATQPADAGGPDGALLAGGAAAVAVLALLVLVVRRGRRR